MAEAQAPQTQTQEEKQAQEIALNRMRAFEVGIAHFCKDAGVQYDEFAKSAGQTPETLGPNLVESMIEAAEAQQGQTTQQ
jgi:hypothetical protein